MSGYKSFTAGERLFAADVNDFLMNQSVMVFADATARTSALSGVIAEGMLTYNKDTGRLEVYDGSDFKVVGVAEIDPVVATGGDDVYEITSGDLVYKVHKFTGSGNFVVTGGGLVEYLLIAGGGGSGGNNTARFAGGGGGAGGLLMGAVEVTAQTYAVVVGAGGAGGASGANDGAQGGNSSAFSLTAVGGGFGAKGSDAVNAGGSGGSGGGGNGTLASAGNGGAGTAGQGFAGGWGTSSVGGAGGGAAGPAASRSTGSQTIFGPPVYSDIDGRVRPYGRGGAPVADVGGSTVTAPTTATPANSGFGANGLYTHSGGNTAGLAGGSGILVIRYPVRYI